MTTPGPLHTLPPSTLLKEYIPYCREHFWRNPLPPSNVIRIHLFITSILQDWHFLMCICSSHYGFLYVLKWSLYKSSYGLKQFAVLLCDVNSTPSLLYDSPYLLFTQNSYLLKKCLLPLIRILVWFVNLLLHIDFSYLSNWV